MKIALVTGGSSGIGREIAVQLAERGTQVLTCGSRAPEAVDDLDHAGISYLRCDLSGQDGVAELTEWVRSQSPALDLLVNNAGIQNECQIGPDLALDAIDREIDINLRAPIRLSCALLPLLETARQGCIVNVSSGLALAPKAASPIYCATKAALSSFSRTLRYQLEERGVRVVDVVTPLVATPMTEGRNAKAISTEDFVRSMLQQLEAGKDEIYVGLSRLLPPILRFAPALAFRIMKNA